jgi:hypothetical protein
MYTINDVGGGKLEPPIFVTRIKAIATTAATNLVEQPFCKSAMASGDIFAE